MTDPCECQVHYLEILLHLAGSYVTSSSVLLHKGLHLCIYDHVLRLPYFSPSNNLLVYNSP